jgi:hypothetical protein
LGGKGMIQYRETITFKNPDTPDLSGRWVDVERYRNIDTIERARDAYKVKPDNFHIQRIDGKTLIFPTELVFCMAVEWREV